MTVEDKIEANANLVKWCVHVLGPDDIYAEPSHAEAVRKADELNRTIHSRIEDGEDVLCFAYADMWPYSAEHHAEAMRDEAEQEITRKRALHAAQSK